MAKAKQTVERAKGTASKVKQTEATIRMESMQKLNEKLETATKIKDESVGKRRKNASEHLEMVDSRKEAYTQDVFVLP